MDTGIARTSGLAELSYARARIVNTCKAFKLQPIDLVCLDFKDLEILKSETLNGKRMGFTGKQVIHPGQIDIVQEIFMPSLQGE